MASENLFEKIFTPDVMAELQQIQYKDQLILRFLQLAFGAKVPPGTEPPTAAPPAGSSPIAAVPVIPMTFDPEVINRLLVMARFLGVAESKIMMLQHTVTAGSTVNIVLPVTQGKVMLFFGGLDITTDYVSNSLTAVITADGQAITPAPYEYVFSRDTDTIKLGEFYYLERSLIGTITNDSNTDAVITWKANVILIDGDFFHNKFYVPLITKAIQAVENLVAS